MLFKNKKGEENNTEAVVFILINLVFFGILFAFVFNTGNNETFYEQVYAKQIALAIDGSKPGTVISINTENIKETIVERNLFEDSVKIIDNQVKFTLSKSREGYSIDFFSDYNVDAKFNTDASNLRIVIKNDE